MAGVAQCPAQTSAVSVEDTCETSCLHPEAGAAARAALPEDTCVERTTPFLKLVGDPTRLRILIDLTTSELCVCDFVTGIGLRERATSHRLRRLRASHVVTSLKMDHVVSFRLLDQHGTSLIAHALDHARE